MKVKVEKLSKNDNTFRTPLYQVDGMPNPPEVGKPLLLTSSTFESGGIFTSLVKEIEIFDENVLIVDTENSTYRIELL